jgi:hypothetical protein
MRRLLWQQRPRPPLPLLPYRWRLPLPHPLRRLLIRSLLQSSRGAAHLPEAQAPRLHLLSRRLLRPQIQQRRPQLRPQWSLLLLLSRLLPHRKG